MDDVEQREHAECNEHAEAPPADEWSNVAPAPRTRTDVSSMWSQTKNGPTPTGAHPAAASLTSSTAYANWTGPLIGRLLVLVSASL